MWQARSCACHSPALDTRTRTRPWTLAYIAIYVYLVTQWYYAYSSESERCAPSPSSGSLIYGSIRWEFDWYHCWFFVLFYSRHSISPNRSLHTYNIVKNWPSREEVYNSAWPTDCPYSIIIHIHCSNGRIRIRVSPIRLQKHVCEQHRLSWI